LSDLTDEARRNREYWDRASREYHDRNAAFIERGLAWGLWQIPEAELQILGDLVGRDVLELGCGEAEWSRALARLGARPVGLDNSAERLRFAREAMARDGLDFPLVHAGAERIPLPDESFDAVFCDWGAMTFADPFRVVPEVTRVLRPGGIFAFSGATPFAWLCLDEPADTYDERLQRDYFGMHRWDTPEGFVEFNLPYGEWIRLFRANGLAVERLVEVRPPEGAASTFRTAAETAWARRWPIEQIWVTHKR
jgi:ubiquinone/menaquinone biosynthesis C-methylase UbiE